nr:TPA_inf: HDC14735 [Drosophila melanogaster]
MLICCMEGCEFNNSISNDEHVRCWLCDEYAHAKCAGITDSVVEMIEGRTGLKWTCETCRVVKSQMGRFMKQTRTEITELFREVRAVYEKLAKLESHITSLDPQKPIYPVDSDSSSNPLHTFEDTNDDKEVEDAESSIVQHNSTNMQKAKIWHHNAAPVVLPLHTNPVILKAVPPMKAVFVSRLVTSTTEDALKHYIVAKLSYPNPDDII